MKINFRQGILRYQSSGMIQQFLLVSNGKVDLLADNLPFEVAIAHRNSDYLHSEQQSVVGAWSFTAGVDNWLYIDIDPLTGQRTFGYTEIAPVINITAPINPVESLHWFDIDDTIMYEYTNGIWRERIRVFVAHMDAASVFGSLGIGLPNFPYAGSQVGLQGPAVNILIGRLLYDSDGGVLRRDNNELMTTESQFFVTGSQLNALRLETAIHTAKAGEVLPEYYVTALTPSGNLELATYEDTGSTVLLMTLKSALVGDIVDTVVQGTVTNPNWNFPTPGQTLWVDNGLLVQQDPNSIDNIGHPLKQVPVARVMSSDTILFDQGLGGIGETGLTGPAGSALPATVAVPGSARLSLPPLLPTSPVVVGDNDPRLTDSRTPLPHVHDASTISLTPVGNITATEIQTAIGQLDSTKVSISGDIMTGLLTLSGDPTAPLESATKQYVDNLVSGLIWIDPLQHVNLIADDVINPSSIIPKTSDLYIVPAGALGVWSGLDGKFVLWDGASWVDLGLVASQLTGLRYGISMESGTTPSGSFAGRKNDIATLVDPLTATFNFSTPINSEAAYVNNVLSLHAYHQYVFDGTKWIEFGGPSGFQTGNNISLQANTLDVIQFSNGGTVDAATLQGSIPSDFAPTVHGHTINPYVNTIPGVKGLVGGTLQQSSEYLATSKADVTPFYADLVNLPVAANVHGMIAHVNNEGAMYFSFGGSWIKLNDESQTQNIPYDMSFYIAGPMQPSVLVGSFIITRNVTIDSLSTESLAVCQASIMTGNPNISYIINLNGTQVGTITFTADTLIGLVNFTSNVLLVPGDLLQIVSPAVTDPDLIDVTVTVVGCSSVSPCTVVGP